MRYKEFEQRIEQMAALASPESCRRFALDSIRLLHESAESAVERELTIKERELLSALVNGVPTRPPDELKGMLTELNESLSHDEIRALSSHPVLTELLCAVDHWIGYQRSGNRHLIARLAINIVNAVDYAIGGHTAEYGIHNMLGAPEMVAEFNRQLHLLAPGTSNS